MYDFLYLTNSQNLDAEYFSERFGFTYLQAKYIHRAATRYSQFLGNSHLKSQRARLETITRWMPGKELSNPPSVFQKIKSQIAVPKKPIDYKNSLRLINQALPLLETGDKELNWLLKYFAEHSRHNDNALIFKRPKEAKRFLVLLQRLDIPFGNLSFSLHFGRQQKPRLLKGYWKSKLGLTQNPKINDCARSNRTIGKHGNLAIGIQFNNKVKASDAVRYAFAMLWIYNEGLVKKAPVTLMEAA